MYIRERSLPRQTRARPSRRTGFAFILNSSGKAHPVSCKQRRVERLALEKSPMFKKITAFGLSAALVLSPLAALAQTDTTAPAAPAAGASTDTMAKPMKAKSMKHPKKHMAKKPMAKPMAPAAPEAPKT